MRAKYRSDPAEGTVGFEPAQRRQYLGGGGVQLGGDGGERLGTKREIPLKIVQQM